LIGALQLGEVKAATPLRTAEFYRVPTSQVLMASVHRGFRSGRYLRVWRHSHECKLFRICAFAALLPRVVRRRMPAPAALADL